MQRIKEIRQLIGAAKLAKAIDKLLIINTEYDDMIRGLKTRLSVLENKELSNIISNADAGLERSSITHSLLTITTKIESLLLLKSNPSIKLEPESDYEKIIGRNGLQPIDWLAKGIEKAKSVCKIHTSDGYVGTGFLIEGGYVFTNHHVIGSSAIAQYSKIEFGYDNPNSASVFYELDHNDFITSEKLDYTRIKVKNSNSSRPLSEWGYLTIKEAFPNKNDVLVIIQHPQGRSKEIALSDGGNGTWEHRLHYKVTTEPGSSGSPVFDIGWNVLALHHAGGNMKINANEDTDTVNEGILFKYIQADVLSKKHERQNIHQERDVSDRITKPIKTLLVYNSADASYIEALRTHLFQHIRNQNILLFDIQNDIPPEANKEDFLKQELENSALILIFISSNLYTRQTMNIALDVEQYVGKKKVIPIRVGQFDLGGTAFEKLKGLPLNGKSIVGQTNTDEVLYDIGQSIFIVIKNMLGIK